MAGQLLIEVVRYDHVGKNLFALTWQSLVTLGAVENALWAEI